MARDCGLLPVRTGKGVDLLGRAEVSWVTLVLQSPDKTVKAQSILNPDAVMKQVDPKYEGLAANDSAVDRTMTAVTRG